VTTRPPGTRSWPPRWSPPSPRPSSSSSPSATSLPAGPPAPSRTDMTVKPVARPLPVSAGPLARPVVPSRGSTRGLGIGEVRLTEGFWGTLQATNAAATLRHCLHWMEELGWLRNFDRVAEGTTAADRPGWQFSDSEVYKLMEALAWE